MPQPAAQLEAPKGVAAGESAYQPKALLPFMKRLPARRVVRALLPKSLNPKQPPARRVARLQTPIACCLPQP